LKTVKTLKKITCIIIIALAGLALVSSCSKEPQRGAKKGKKAPSEHKATALAPNDGKNTLTAVRTGQYVNLSWTFEATGVEIKSIGILRNTTGIDKQKKPVGSVPPDATSFKDCLPDANAHWYWVRAIDKNGKYSIIGPAKVEADKQGAANYIKPADSYKVIITRTDETATVKWEFPEDEYKLIQIARYPKPVSGSYMEKKNIRHTTLAGKSQFSDTMPDPNADYWYWFRITLKSGDMIYKGPIKAEYKNESTKIR